ncbi:hypothetical protein ACJX0J_023738, partial [Zea mays]
MCVLAVLVFFVLLYWEASPSHAMVGAKQPEIKMQMIMMKIRNDIYGECEEKETASKRRNLGWLVALGWTNTTASKLIGATLLPNKATVVSLLMMKQDEMQRDMGERDEEDSNPEPLFFSIGNWGLFTNVLPLVSFVQFILCQIFTCGLLRLSFVLYARLMEMSLPFTLEVKEGGDTHAHVGPRDTHDDHLQLQYQSTIDLPSAIGHVN